MQKTIDMTFMIGMMKEFLIGKMKKAEELSKEIKEMEEKFKKDVERLREEKDFKIKVIYDFISSIYEEIGIDKSLNQFEGLPNGFYTAQTIGTNEILISSNIGEYDSWVFEFSDKIKFPETSISGKIYVKDGYCYTKKSIDKLIEIGIYKKEEIYNI